MRQTSTQVPTTSPVPEKPSEADLVEAACKAAIEEFDRRSEQLIQLIEKNKDAIIRLKASRNAP
jgi:hypothetical protein